MKKEKVTNAWEKILGGKKNFNAALLEKIAQQEVTKKEQEKMLAIPPFMSSQKTNSLNFINLDLNKYTGTSEPPLFPEPSWTIQELYSKLKSLAPEMTKTWKGGQYETFYNLLWAITCQVHGKLNGEFQPFELPKAYLPLFLPAFAFDHQYKKAALDSAIIPMTADKSPIYNLWSVLLNPESPTSLAKIIAEPKHEGLAELPTFIPYGGDIYHLACSYVWTYFFGMVIYVKDSPNYQIWGKTTPLDKVPLIPNFNIYSSLVFSSLDTPPEDA